MVRNAAETVRKSLSYANIEIVPNGKSFKFRMNDSSYRRSAEEKKRLEEDFKALINERS